MALLEIQWNPDPKRLRGFGAICAIVFLALGAWALLAHMVIWMNVGPDISWRVAAGFWTIAAICAGLATVRPTALRPLYLGLTIAGLPVGFAVGHVLMALVFFGIVTPIALVFRLTRRDALERGFDRRAPSYWTPRRAVADPFRYFRQF